MSLMIESEDDDEEDDDDDAHSETNTYSLSQPSSPLGRHRTFSRFYSTGTSSTETSGQFSEYLGAPYSTASTTELNNVLFEEDESDVFLSDTQSDGGTSLLEETVIVDVTHELPQQSRSDDRSSQLEETVTVDVTHERPQQSLEVTRDCDTNECIVIEQASAQASGPQPQSALAQYPDDILSATEIRTVSDQAQFEDTSLPALSLPELLPDKHLQAHTLQTPSSDTEPPPIIPPPHDETSLQLTLSQPLHNAVHQCAMPMLQQLYQIGGGSDSIPMEVYQTGDGSDGMPTQFYQTGDGSGFTSSDSSSAYIDLQPGSHH